MANFELYKTPRWKTLRSAQLSREPKCNTCQAPATVCDHVKRHGGDPAKFWAGPFQSLCRTCHSSAKQFAENRGFSSEIGADGWPIDKNHPANRGER
jgi:5-methylcytosine-specific restriction enzyme A